MPFAECDEIRYEVRDGAAWIVIDRPAKRNALTTEMYRVIGDGFRRALADDGVDVIVLTGSGGNFAAGGDLNESMDIVRSDDPASKYAFVDTLPYDTVRLAEKTTIAMINGPCVGGALALAASMDLLIASDTARFGIPEARSGVYDPWGPEFLAPRISRTHLNYLAYTGELITAQQALDWNLINAVAPHDELQTSVLALIERVRSTTAPARSGYKRYITQHDVISPLSAAIVGRSGAQRSAGPRRADTDREQD